MSTLASDDFNRANTATLGANWTPQNASNRFWQVSSNTAIPNSYANDTGEWYSGITWPNDQWSQCTCNVGSTASAGVGPAVRHNAATTRYRLVASTAGSNNFELGKEVSGSFTLIWDRTSAFTSGNTVRLEAQGTTLRAFNNGVQIGANSTDSSIASGPAGIIYSSTDSGSSVDNWSGGDFSGTTWPIGPFPPILAILAQ